jgi:hypothetical protein
MVSRRHRDVVMPLLALPDPPRTFSDELLLISAAKMAGRRHCSRRRLPSTTDFGSLPRVQTPSWRGAVTPNPMTAAL